MDTNWTRLHKFGGSSLANRGAYEHVSRVIADNREGPTAVVASAQDGVTDKLVELVEKAGARDSSYRQALNELRQQQLDLASQLLPEGRADEARSQLNDDFRDIEEVLRAEWLLKSASQNAVELISGYGELWSSRLLSEKLASEGVSSAMLNARDVLVVEHNELGPVVDWEQTKTNLDQWLETRSVDVLVITGYIASTPDGRPTTLGRNGSDFTASIFGSLFDVGELHIWTDVTGVMTADPRKVPDSRVLEQISYDEAMELAYFGANVLHPRSLAPAVSKQIPIYIRHTGDPDFGGTCIKQVSGNHSAVKGFSTIDGMALLNLEGSGMVGVPGVASRLFDGLREAGVSVVMISQASSEHSICFAVPEDQAAEAKEAAEKTFYVEMDQGLIERITTTPDCSILAAVGDGMAGTPGIAGKFFDALARAGINIRAIAQGSSERNISAVIDSSDATQAMRAAHSGFYLSNQTLSVGIIGPGNVGKTLLRQVEEEIERLRDDEMVDLRIRGLINSSNMLLAEETLDFDDWESQLDAAGDANLDAFVDHIQTDYHPHAVLVDCTASEAISAKYSSWLERGIHIVTPNKKANSGDLETYNALKELEKQNPVHYLYETTVCAGLPIIQTLENLRETGDEIISIEGVFSGTLSYLFNSLDEERPFSEVLNDAYEKGYTEPDPRDDLSGMDVARKVIIIGREMGLDIGIEDVDLQGLVPEDLQDGSAETFMERIPEYDDYYNDIRSKAEASGNVLRYVGRVDKEGNVSAGLEQYSKSHPFGRIDRTDNIVQFKTRRYYENPLVVQGPGAGPDVTAAGIFADMLRLVQAVGVPD